MWMIRWFLIAMVVVFISLFIGKNLNPENTISIDYIFGQTDDISPLAVMFFSYVAGFLTWFVISMLNYFKMRSELSSRDKLIKNLKQELNEYRSQSLVLDGEADKTQVIRKPESPAAAATDSPAAPLSPAEE